MISLVTPQRKRASSCLENPMDRGAWRATYSPWGRKESDMMERLTLMSKHQKIRHHGEPSAGASGGSSRSLGAAAPNPLTPPHCPSNPLSSLDVSEPWFRGISPTKGSISSFCLMLVSEDHMLPVEGTAKGPLNPHAVAPSGTEAESSGCPDDLHC